MKLPSEQLNVRQNGIAGHTKSNVMRGTVFSTKLRVFNDVIIIIIIIYFSTSRVFGFSLIIISTLASYYYYYTIIRHTFRIIIYYYVRVCPTNIITKNL